MQLKKTEVGPKGVNYHLKLVSEKRHPESFIPIFASIHIFPMDSQAGDVTSSKSFLLEKVSIVKSRGVKSPNPTFSRYQDPGKIQEPSV